MNNSNYLLILGLLLNLKWLIPCMFNADFPSALVIISNNGMTVRETSDIICKEDGVAYFKVTASI
jgi:hypothetical protein